MLTPGRVSEWTLTSAGRTSHRVPFNLSLVDNLTRPAVPTEPTSQTVPAGLVAGPTILFKPGDGVAFEYAESPTWAWRALW